MTTQWAPVPEFEWRDGSAQLAFVAVGYDPVPDPNGRYRLSVDSGLFTLSMNDGHFSISTCLLMGKWLKLKDGQRSARNGTVTLSGPPVAAHGWPDWLIARADKLTLRLNLKEEA